MAQQDETVQGLAQDVESRTKQREVVRPLADTPNIVKIILFLAMGAYIIYSDKLVWPQSTRLIVVVVAAAIFFWVGSQSYSTGEIPEDKICAIAYQRLKFYQRHYFGNTTRLPQGKIVMNPVGVPQYESWDSDIIKWWNHKFRIVSQDNTEIFEGLIRTNPLNGYHRGILQLREGFTGMEDPERIYVGRDDLAKFSWAKRKLSEFPPYDGF
jgi:hypothetical protein